MNVKRITALLFVNEIETVLPFWIDRLGFAKTVEVARGDKLGFVILQSGSVELMYQSYASVEDDLPAIAADIRRGPTFLYVEVADLASLISALKDAAVYLPVRETFYGAREIGVKDPAGHFLTFAQMGAAPANP